MKIATLVFRKMQNGTSYLFCNAPVVLDDNEELTQADIDLQALELNGTKTEWEIHNVLGPFPS